MYVLAEMKDIVHVKPWQFNQDQPETSEDFKKCVLIFE